MTHITGDIHGSPLRILDMCQQLELRVDDVIVILGDVGLNNDMGSRDREIKEYLSCEKPTIFCVHGNHEARPQTIGTYKEKIWNGGRVLYEEVYPNLLFPIDGEIFTLDGQQCMVIGGAYSVDKPLRLAYGAPWFPDEQPSEEIKAYVEQQLRTHRVDVIFSHTCPYKYIPREVFLPGIDQSTVDDSTERWLDTIEESTDYRLWFCGHWHTEKHIDKIHFLYRNTEILIDELLISVCQKEYSSAEASKTYTIDELDAFLDECLQSGEG